MSVTQDGRLMLCAIAEYGRARDWYRDDDRERNS